jgi:hypothetical protein
MTTATLTRQTKKLKKSTKLATEKLQKPERKTPYERRPDLCERVEAGDRKAALKLSRLFWERRKTEGWTNGEMLAEALALRAFLGESMTQTRWFRIEKRRGGYLVRSEGLGVMNWKRIILPFTDRFGGDIWDAIEYVAELVTEALKEERDGFPY